MIYNKKYKIKFFINQSTGQVPVLDYINSKPSRDRERIFKYLDFLREHQGYLDEPYSKHVVGKVRELRISVANNYHRIFYFTFINQTIILLHAFLKRTDKTLTKEINKALENYQAVIDNQDLYDQD